MKISIKKAVIILSVLSVVGISLIFFLASKKPKNLYSTVNAENKDLVQTVAETGVVKPVKEIDLNFLTSGNINKIIFQVGDSVKEGDVLVELDYNDLSFQKQQIDASLEIANTDLLKLRNGASANDIALAEANAKKAKTNYESALKEKTELLNTLNEEISQANQTLFDLSDNTEASKTAQEQTVISAKNALNNAKKTYQTSIDNKKVATLTTMEANNAAANTALDTIDRTLEDEDAKNTLGVNNLANVNIAKNKYNEAKLLFNSALELQNKAKSASADNEDLSNALSGSLVLLNKTFTLLNLTFEILGDTITSNLLSQSELDTLKSSINSQITLISASISAVQLADQNLNSAILAYNTNVNAAEDALKSAEASLSDSITNAQNKYDSMIANKRSKLAQSDSKIQNYYEIWQVSSAELSKIKSPARQEDLILYEARVKKAQAEQKTISNKIKNSILVSPINGVISKINYENGEQVNLSKPVLSLIGEGSFDIEVDISEADISKVSLNNKVEITLDAYGSDFKLAGFVGFIEPAETVIQDVIYYKVKVYFTDKEMYKQYLKPGMTANVIITTAQKSSTIAIPSRAIIDRNGDGKFTRLLLNKKIKEVPIKTGLYADDGLVEILNGVALNDIVITSIRDK